MPFSRLPAEIRIQIWKLSLRDGPRSIILDLCLEVASSHHPGPPSPAEERILIGGCFVSKPHQHFPVRPVASQITIKSLGALCYESRAVTLACYPDVIRIKKSRYQDRDGKDPAQLLLRCNLQTDVVLEDYKETGWWYFDNPVEFAMNAYESLRGCKDGAARAEEFKSTLNKIHHLVMPYPNVKLRLGSVSPPFGTRKIFLPMRSLKTVTLCTACFPRDRDMLAGSEPIDPADRSMLLDDCRMEPETSCRFVSPACYTTSMVVLQSLVEPLLQAQMPEPALTETLESKLRELGFDKHSSTVRTLPLQAGPRKDGQQDDDIIVLPKLFLHKQNWLE
ncbi:hypothetical protein NM208_g9397 [Fusarium decemcellulare]|uniref:Uncharacterized protein n=1 Tax=Fusarium decemcellulare TaxID=57161 RepID=A0ACC1S1X5_9HYPO|nr:hypothetical protein NM208_g9397 [Fusarium decemcellulare]